MNSSNVRPVHRSLLLFFIAIVGAIGAGCSVMHQMGSSLGGPHLDATGPQTEDKRTVDTFDRVDVGGAFEVDVTIGSPASVTLDAPKDLLPHLSSEVNGGTLRLKSDISFSLTGSERVRTHIVMPSLTAATVSGAAKMKVDGTVTGARLTVDASGAATFECTAKTDTTSVEASGSARVTVSDLAARSVKAGASGASTCILSGTADEATIEASGASSVHAASLSIKQAKVQASGASNAAVKAEDTLSAEADGGSSVHYTGNAKVTKDASGGSEIVEGD